MASISDVMSGADYNVGALSDGEFDQSYLANYEYKSELNECWRLALEELQHEPYLGRVSNARVMGLAMGLLRDKYGVDAPRGWYPAMKRLRDAASESTTTTKRSVSTEGAEGASRGRHEPAARPPTNEERKAMQTATKMLHEAIIRWEQTQVKQGVSLQDECERTKKELTPVSKKALNYSHRAKWQALDRGDPAPEWAIRFRADFLKGRDRLLELFRHHGVD